MLPCTLYTMWPISLQSMKVLNPTVMGRCIFKKMHYLTFDLGVKVTHNCTQYPQNHVPNVLAKFVEVATSNGLGGDVFTRKYAI